MVHGIEVFGKVSHIQNMELIISLFSALLFCVEVILDHSSQQADILFDLLVLLYINSSYISFFQVFRFHFSVCKHLTFKSLKWHNAKQV